MRVDGFRITTDYEKGRNDDDWLPRRLGGGIGNSRFDKKDDSFVRTEIKKMKEEERELRQAKRQMEKKKEKVVEKVVPSLEEGEVHPGRGEVKEETNGKEVKKEEVVPVVPVEAV